MGGDSGVKGMITYVMGDNTAKVDIAGNTALKSSGAMAITGNNTANLMNIAGSFGFGAATGVGASLALNDMEVNSIVNVGKATINAGSLKATTDLDGKINSLAVAGGIAAASDDDEAGKMAQLTTKITNNKNKVMNVWRSANDKLGAIVSVAAGAQLLITERSPQKLSFYPGAVVVEGPCGLGCHTINAVLVEKSRKAHKVQYIKTNPLEMEGAVHEYFFDGTRISSTNGKKRLQLIMHDKRQITPAWHDFRQEE